MTAAPISSNITMGNYVTYSMTVSNGGGASNMRWVQPQLTWVSPETFLGFNTQPSSNGCHVLYDVSTNTLFLDNESGNSVWISSGPIGGTAPPIGNSVCTIDLQNSTVSVPANSNTMQLNLKVKLETGFPGTIENIFLSAANNNITLDPSWYLGWWWMGPNGIIR